MSNWADPICRKLCLLNKSAFLFVQDGSLIPSRIINDSMHCL